MSSRQNRSDRGAARARPAGALAALALGLLGWLGALSAPPAFAAGPPRFLVLAPTEPIIDNPAELVIAIAIIDPDRQVDPTTLTLWVDDREVTSSARVTPEAVTWIPDRPFSPGAHSFEIRARTLTGEEIAPVRRGFMDGSVPAESRGLETTGRLTLLSMSDDLTGPGRRLRQEPARTSNASLTMSSRWKEWTIQGQIFLTSDEDQRFQPRNRYAIQIDRGWVGMAVGDLNYRFSPMVLQGKRTRGLGGRLRLGVFELTALTGTIRREVEGSLRITPATPDTSLVGLIDKDSGQIAADTTAVGGTFERKLIGARLAIGRGRKFQFGLDGLRVRDDLGSIRNGLMPKDNLVVGGNILVAPLGRRLIAEANWAVSAFSDDITGGALSDSLLEVRFEGSFPDFRDYDNIFIVNYSTSPLDPRQLSGLAWETTMKGNLQGHSYRARYRRVGSAFRNLAAPSLPNDQAGFRFTDTFRTLHRRLELSAEYEGFEDNLSNDKIHTTDTRILGASAAILPGRPDIRSVTFGVRQLRRENDASAPAAGEADLRRDDTTTSVTIGAGYHLRLGPEHEIALGYSRVRTDALAEAADGLRSDWRIGWSTRFSRLPLMLEAGVAGSRAEYPASGAELDYYNFELGANYRFLDGRLETSASAARLTGEGSAGLSGGERNTWSAGVRYSPRPGTSLSGRVNRASFRGEADPARDYDETLVSLRLAQNFSM